MLRKLHERARDEKGFTLIELLVVILIIGILAAIAIPSFINQRSKGTDAEAKTAAKTAAEAQETYFTDNQSYTTSTTDLTTIEPTLTDLGSRLEIEEGDADSYVVSVHADRDGNVVEFKVDRDANGTTTRPCVVGGSGVNRGGCPTSGTW
jgi:type IV pilus assembly protein PilA